MAVNESGADAGEWSSSVAAGAGVASDLTECMGVRTELAHFTATTSKRTIAHKAMT